MWRLVFQTALLWRFRGGPAGEDFCVSKNRHTRVRETEWQRDTEHSTPDSSIMMCDQCIQINMWLIMNVLIDRVIGLPSEEEWPTDVTLSRQNFSPQNPQPITDCVPEISEKGAELLLVCLHTASLPFLWQCFYSGKTVAISYK